MRNGGGVGHRLGHIRVLSSSLRPSRPPEFSAMGWDRNARNLTSHWQGPPLLFFMFPVLLYPSASLVSEEPPPVSRCLFLHQLEGGTPPPKPTHAIYSINKSNRRLRKKEGGEIKRINKMREMHSSQTKGNGTT